MTRNEITQGTCQICGGLHNIRDGRVLAHTYPVRGGIFDGTCPGVGQLCFELSQDQVSSSIEVALQLAADLEASATELSAPAMEPKAVCFVYVRTDQCQRGEAPGCRWLSGTIEMAREPWFAMRFMLKTAEGSEYYLHASNSDDTVLDVATFQNQRYAVALAKHARQLHEFADWQIGRTAH